MKKLLRTLAAIGMLASTLNADFGRVEMGGGVWENQPSGGLNYIEENTGAQGSYTSNEKSNSSAYVWLLVKHPIPILPNARVEYTTLSDEGSASGKFQDFKFDVPGKGNIDMTQFDAILYYNILDNLAWITLDLGLDVKIIDTQFKAEGTLDGVANTSNTVNQAITLPMGYARARVEIPVTNIGVEVNGKYVTYDGSTVSDVSIKVDYTFDFVPVVQPAIEVGYRMQSFDLSYNEDQTTMKLDFSGVYAGIMLRF